MDLGTICFPVPCCQSEAEKNDELIRFRGKLKAESTLISLYLIFFTHSSLKPVLYSEREKCVDVGCYRIRFSKIFLKVSYNTFPLLSVKSALCTGKCVGGEY